MVSVCGGGWREGGSVSQSVSQSVRDTERRHSTVSQCKNIGLRFSNILQYTPIYSLHHHHDHQAPPALSSALLPLWRQGSVKILVLTSTTTLRAKQVERILEMESH